jgi:hypothetical protein
LTELGASDTLASAVSFRAFLLAALVLPIALFTAPRNARADADIALTPLLGKLATHAERFEQMKKRASYTLSGKMDSLDVDGNVDGTKEIVVRVMPAPDDEPITDVLRYTEDGEDKTEEAREKARERKARRQAEGKAKKDFHLPFLASEQSRYVFTLVERDRVYPTRVRIAFVPKVPAEDAYKGSAWVDENEGEVLSLGFSLSKNPTFIDHVDITVSFDLPTKLGRAPSRLTFEAKGGLLFVRKRYRGTVTISSAAIVR